MTFVRLSLSLLASGSALSRAWPRSAEHLIPSDGERGLRTLRADEEIIKGSPEPDALGGKSMSSSEL